MSYCDKVMDENLEDYGNPDGLTSSATMKDM
jgi:hypothetical protein